MCCAFSAFAILLLGFSFSANAFTLTDHAVKAFIRPCKRIAAYEAETLPGVQANVVDDKLAANGRAVRLKPLQPPLAFKRRLERGTYSVWCIGRSSKQPSRYREPMVVHLSVKGPAVGPGGKRERQWRMRINYMHRAYQDVAHLYFDANAPGEYEVAFSLGTGSTHDLFVDRIELRDVLAATWKKGYKSEPVLFGKGAYAGHAEAAKQMYRRDEALRRARDIAASFPPRNAILTSGGMPKKGFYQEFRLGDAGLAEPTVGRWLWRMNESLEQPWVMRGPTLPVADELDKLDEDMDAPKADAGLGRLKPGAAAAKGFGVPPKGKPDFNWGTEKPGPAGSYSVEDYHAFKKLPGRWPDDGGGYFTPEPRSGKLRHNFYFNVLGGAFKWRLFSMRSRICRLADEFYKTGHPRFGFAGAVMLAHWADQFPSIDHTVQGSMNATWGTYPFNNFTGRSAGSFGKLDYSGWAGPNNIPVILAYDKLFPFIKDNQLLADAIGQTVPWVKTPQDVIELIDVKLVQHLFDVSERQHVRYGNLRCDPMVAVVQGNNEAGLAMLRRIVNRSDLHFGSLLDTLTCRRSRDSTSFIGSMYYAKGPSLSSGDAIASVTRFAERYGLPDLDLTRPVKSTILRQSAQWLIEPYTAGVHINGVGDVAGPQGYPTMTLGEDKPERVLFDAWKRYGDARFAWMLENVYGYPPATAEELIAKAKEAAGTVKADPRHALRSRVLGGFGVAILEGNLGAKDFLGRSGVVMRAGYGSGHGHADSLNLEIFSKGIVATGEFGGRGGYGVPATGAAQSHCLVTVDGRIGIAKATLLADLPGMPCMEAGFHGARGSDAAARRFVALIDVDDDDAYILDVVRASGGKRRTYWFHGNQTEAVETPKSITEAPGVAGGKDDGLDDLDDEKPKRGEFKWGTQAFAHNLRPEDKGKLPLDIYQAVWPLDRKMEESILKRIRQIHPFPKGRRPLELYNPDAPKKYTRLILPSSRGRRIKTVVAKSEQVQYRIVCAGVSEERPLEETSVFAGVIEPFAGEPFVRSVQSLSVSPKATGGSVGLAVALAGGRRDVFLQSADVAALHRTDDASKLSASGRFATVSYDGSRLRACALVAGTALNARDVSIRVARPFHEARIVSVDTIKREIALDARLPASLLSQSYFQIGQEKEPFRIASARQGKSGTILRFEKTAESYRSPVFTVREGREIVGTLEPEHRQQRGWLTNETHDKGWPVVGVRIGAVRWMGTSFRGGARMGGTISWDRVPDADGDGKRTLTIKSHGAWRDDMTVEVLNVDEALRAFAFVVLKAPEGYAGTRSYAGGEIVNERGEHISTSVIPGKMGSFLLPEDAKVSMKDFTDADGDGQAKFHVYYFGPGDPVRLQTHASLLRQKDGAWLITANTPIEVTVRGNKKVFREEDLKRGSVSLRL